MAARVSSLFRFYRPNRGQASKTREYSSPTGIRDGRFVTLRRRRYKKYAGIKAPLVSLLAGCSHRGGAGIIDA